MRWSNVRSYGAQFQAHRCGDCEPDSAACHGGETLEVVKDIPTKRSSKRTEEQIVDQTVQQVAAKILDQLSRTFPRSALLSVAVYVIESNNGEETEQVHGRRCCVPALRS